MSIYLNGLYIYVFLVLLSVNALHTTIYLEKNYSEGVDIAYATCVYSDIIYVIGSINYHMFIDGISIYNNSRLFYWVSNWVGELYDCIVINSSLFVVGVKRANNDINKWFIGLFDAKLNLVAWRESYDQGAALSITYGNGYLYVSGYADTIANDHNDIGWIVEKVSINNIFNYTYVASNPSSGSDIASVIGINSISGEIFVVGINADRRTWRIEVYDENLMLLKSKNLNIPNYPYSIVFDSTGNAYISGTSTVAKVNKNLDIVAKADIGGVIAKMVLYNNSHLVLVTQHSDKLGIQRHYVYILDDDLDIVDVLCTTCSKDYPAYVDRGKSVLIGREFYIAGYGISSNRYRKDTFVILYSIKIPEKLTIIHRAKSDDKSFKFVIASLAVIAIAGIYLVKKKKIAKNKKRNIKR